MKKSGSIETPIGTIHFAVDGETLTALRFDEPFEGDRVTTGVEGNLRAWLRGDLSALDKLEVRLDGTPFQQKVWKALREIPPGETVTYGYLARKLGSHPRAIGSANGSNRIGIVIPCHRVIASDGGLCGYAWGTARKQWLLDHERASLRAHGRLSVAG